MKIELTCGDNDKYERRIEVYALCFNPQDKRFRMPYFEGGDFLTEMLCPIMATPTQLQFQWDRVAIHFERQEDADAVGAWLIEGEEKAQVGYRNLRG